VKIYAATELVSKLRSTQCSARSAFHSASASEGELGMPVVELVPLILDPFGGLSTQRDGRCHGEGTTHAVLRREATEEEVVRRGTHWLVRACAIEWLPWSVIQLIDVWSLLLNLVEREE
jgi:hypothetical protein